MSRVVVSCWKVRLRCRSRRLSAWLARWGLWWVAVRRLVGAEAAAGEQGARPGVNPSAAYRVEWPLCDLVSSAAHRATLDPFRAPRCRATGRRLDQAPVPARRWLGAPARQGA